MGPWCFQTGKRAPRDFTRVRMSMARAAMLGTTQFPNWCKRRRSSWLTEWTNQRSIGTAFGSFHTSWRCLDSGSTLACSKNIQNFNEKKKFYGTQYLMAWHEVLPTVIRRITAEEEDPSTVGLGFAGPTCENGNEKVKKQAGRPQLLSCTVAQWHRRPRFWHSCSGWL